MLSWSLCVHTMFIEQSSKWSDCAILSSGSQGEDKRTDEVSTGSCARLQQGASSSSLRLWSICLNSSWQVLMYGWYVLSVSSERGVLQVSGTLICATCTIPGDRKGRHVGRDHQLCAITTASDRSKCTAPEAYSSSELPCIHYILSSFSCTRIYHHIANTFFAVFVDEAGSCQSTTRVQLWQFSQQRGRLNLFSPRLSSSLGELVMYVQNGGLW